MTAPVRIPFALKGEELVSISQVKSGLACGCICPECKAPLIARKGEVNIHHFAHSSSDEQESCTRAFETSIHKMAKQILEEEGYIRLPEFDAVASEKDLKDRVHYERECVEAKGTRRFSKVEVEYWFDDIRPDVLVYGQSGAPIMIEVYVTHKVDQEKHRKIEEKGIPTVEIDLSSVSYDITKEKLRELVVGDLKNKKWLYSPGYEEAKELVRSILQKKLVSINERIREERKRLSAVYAEQIRQEKELKFKVIREARAERERKKEEDRIRQESLQETGNRWLICRNCQRQGKKFLHKFSFSENLVCPECGETMLE